MTTPYNLSGSCRSKGFGIVLLLLFVSICYSQSASEASIKNSFSSVALQAYQQRSVSRITDFYQYLEILASKQTSDELASQAEQNVIGLFASELTPVTDFTSDEAKSISLLELLRKIRNSGITFEVNESFETPQTFDNYWLVHYGVGIKGSDKFRVFKIHHRIYLQKELKLFGAVQKNVWSLRLGEVSK
ncbi:MAG TPA: hypothetical protein VF581_02625 [Flavobacterium sp.]